MAGWNEIIMQFQSMPNDKERAAWLDKEFNDQLGRIGDLRNSTNVIFYSSAFLQKPTAPPIDLQINLEDINGLMALIHGMDCKKGLTLMLHTPGGVTNATETIVSYLRSKFGFIEVIIPTYAMSAGTMIALSSDRVIMGRQSQMGPIDPQLPVNGRMVSALAIIDQFEEAEKSIKLDKSNAVIWASILNSLGPALLQEARRSISYSKQIVAKWLESYMFRGLKGTSSLAQATAEHFSTSKDNNNHGRRIDRDEARAHHIIVEDLEENQELQEAVLTAYHLMTLLYQFSPTNKIIAGSNNKKWMKSFRPPNPQQQKPSN